VFLVTDVATGAPYVLKRSRLAADDEEGIELARCVAAHVF
jgi:hypothetical protein